MHLNRTLCKDHTETHSANKGKNTPQKNTLPRGTYGGFWQAQNELISPYMQKFLNIYANILVS